MPPRRLAALLALLAILVATWARATGQPNVVVFLVDDLGWNDTSVDHGLPKADGVNDHYRTPNLEKLAAEGVRFAQAYVTPVCTPTRVSLLTGLSAARHGVSNWTLRREQGLGVVDRGVALPDWNCNGLQPAGAGVPRGFERAETLPALLRAAGYRTIHLGKAHYGSLGTPGADPRNLGFDVNVGGGAMGHPASHLGRNGFAKGDSVYNVPDLDEFKGKDVTLAQALTDRAIAEIERAKADGKPFFVQLAHYAVHVPIEPADTFGGVYAGTKLSGQARHYAEMVSDVDASVGRVLAALERLDLARETIVIFLSDNGGFAQREGTFKPLNLPLRSGKGSAYEGGIRTPMIMRWPGVAKAGLLTSGLARVEDLLPTLLAAAGGKVPSDIDGADLSPLLRGETRATPDYTWHYPHVWGGKGPGIEPFAAIREGDLKLVWFFVGDRLELYDLAKDPGEARDLSAERAGDANRLKAKLADALRAAGRELPTAAGEEAKGKRIK